MRLPELRSNIKNQISKIFCGIFFILLLLFPPNVRAAFSGGINIGDHFSEFDEAANLSGGTGWVYVMMQPEDWPKLAGFLTKYPNLNIIVRGHYPDVSLTSDYAQRWADGLAQANINRAIYFMPVNEPNFSGESQGGIKASEVISYINSLKGDLQNKNLLGTKVKLLSPILNLYTLSDAGVPTGESMAPYIKDLGGWSFFSQFEGICLNLYGQFDNNVLDPNAPLIKKGQGYRDFLKTHFGADATSAQNAKIFAVETGVMKLQDAKVKYKENATEIVTYLNSVKSLWGADPNFVMYAIFSYDPGVYPSSPWIYDQKGVLGAMGLKEGVIVSPTPVTSGKGLYEEEYRRIKGTNQALVPREIQVKEDPKCLFNINIRGRCLIAIGQEASDPKFEGRLAYESNKYQPAIVPQEKVVSIGETEDKCDLFCAIGRAFGLVPSQLSNQESGAFQAYLPRSVSSSAQNATEESVLAATTNVSQEIKEGFADLRCLVLPRQFNDTCRSNLANLPVTPPVSEPTTTPIPGGPTTTPPSSQPTPTLPPVSSRPACEEGSGDCAVSYLENYFPNETAARIASKICQRESGSNPFAANRGCLTGQSVDYSLGLFQINLLAHCASDAFTYTWNPPSCTINDNKEARDKVKHCEELLLDPDTNIQWAVDMSSNGTNWGPWYTDAGCDPYQ